CLAVQLDRDLAATLHSALPLPTPVLAEDPAEPMPEHTDDPLDLTPFEAEEDEEQALARAIRQEQQEIDA
ncbi:MAG: chromosome partitioning protein, partial [Pseudomonas sp.]|nr:chromosome partitioning protein [Pseudomonas sp.]